MLLMNARQSQRVETKIRRLATPQVNAKGNQFKPPWPSLRRQESDFCTRISRDAGTSQLLLPIPFCRIILQLVVDASHLVGGGVLLLVQILGCRSHFNIFWTSFQSHQGMVATSQIQDQTDCTKHCHHHQTTPYLSLPKSSNHLLYLATNCSDVTSSQRPHYGVAQARS
jgi:hypothetical protein